MRTKGHYGALTRAVVLSSDSDLLYRVDNFLRARASLGENQIQWLLRTNSLLVLVDCDKTITAPQLLTQCGAPCAIEDRRLAEVDSMNHVWFDLRSFPPYPHGDTHFQAGTGSLRNPQSTDPCYSLPRVTYVYPWLTTGGPGKTPLRLC